MKIQKTGPDSVLVVLGTDEFCGENDLRRKAYEALKSEGIVTGDPPVLTAYTSGSMTIVFVRANVHEYTYFEFNSAEDLIDAAFEARNLLPGSNAKLLRMNERLFIATDCSKACELLREYAFEVIEDHNFGSDAEILISEEAFKILTGRC